MDFSKKLSSLKQSHLYRSRKISENTQNTQLIINGITIVFLSLLIPNYSQYILKLKLVMMTGIKIIVHGAGIQFIYDFL
jgi:hypothetical protein